MLVSQLHGLDAKTADLMGKPSIGAYYAREDYRSHTLLPNAKCVICGRNAAEPHHVVPRGHARGFTLDTPLGRFVCLSPLFAVCRRCHDGFASGYKLDAPRYEVEWVWLDEAKEVMWWSGEIVPKVCFPGDERIFEFGFYRIIDTKTGGVLECSAP